MDLLNWGANYGPSIELGEYWRLLSSTFLHGGIAHLMANMFGLLFVGICLEPLLGKTKFAFAYLLTGVIASLSSIYWYEATVSVGASGAIFGLNGLVSRIILTKNLPHEFGSSSICLLIFLGFNLITGFIENIDNAAHIGGLLSGFILGILIAKLDKKIGKLSIQRKYVFDEG